MKKIQLLLFALCLIKVRADLPQIFNVGFQINQDNVPKLMAFLLEDDYHVRANVSDHVGEFHKVLKLDNVSHVEFMEILRRSELSPFHLEVEDAFRKLKIKPGPACQEFFKNPKLNLLELPKVLQILNIDMSLLFMRLNIQPENDTLIFDTFSKGNFSQDSLTSAMAVLNLTGSDVFAFLAPKVLEGLEKMSLGDFVNLLRPYETVKVLQSLFETKHIASKDLAVTPFQIILDEFNNTIHTLDESLATAVTKNTFVTTQDLYELIGDAQNCVSLHLFNETHHDITVTSVEQVALDYVTLTTNGVFKYVPLAGKYPKSLHNCTYVTINGITQISDVKNEDPVLLLKNATVKFVSGAPLICNDTLYGLASRSEGSTIEFIKFFLPQSSASLKEVSVWVVFFAVSLTFKMF